jgi:hypothetical protein
MNLFIIGFLKSTHQEASVSINVDSVSTMTDISLKRQKLVRQKSFEIDSSDDTDLDGLIEKAKPDRCRTLPSAAKLDKARAGRAAAKAAAGVKKRPDLTIKIYDSSFDAGNPDVDPAAEPFRSPNLHISGISINRSPPGVPVSSASLSPKYQIHLPPGPTPAVLTVASVVNRNR